MVRRSNRNRKISQSQTSDSSNDTNNSNVENLTCNHSNAICKSKSTQAHRNFDNIASSMPVLIPHNSNVQNVVSHVNSHTRLPRFSGEPCELNLFISTFQNYAEINKLSDQQLLFEACQNLDNPAKQLYAQHTEFDPIITSEQLFSLLNEHFQISDYNIHKQSFDTLSMQTDESIRNVVHRINYLTKKAFPEISDAVALNRIKLDKFWTIVPIHIKQQIHFSTKTKIFEDVVKAAIDAEAFILETQIGSTSTKDSENLKINAIQAQLQSQATTIREMSDKLNPLSNSSSNHHSDEHFPHKSKFKSRRPISRRQYQNNNHKVHSKFQSNHNSHQRHFQNSNHNRRANFHNRFHHVNNRQNHHFNRFPFPQTSDTVPFPLTQNIPLCTSTSSNFSSNPAISCQYCFGIGHTANVCPTAMNFFQSKKVTPPVNSQPASQIPQPAERPVPSSHEIITNVNVSQPNIPIVNLTFASLSVPVLVDTGSSVSLVSHQFFNSNKDKIKYRNLSRSVRISTINSEVKFIGCIEVSFKISQAHYRHPMFICEFGADSAFEALLGFDFMRKYNLVVIPDIEACKINNEYIPFINRKSKFTPPTTNLISVDSNHTEANNLPPDTAVDFSQLLHAKPFYPSKFNKAHSSQDVVDVSLAQKLILQPNDSAFFKFKCTLPDTSFLNKDLIFIPKCKNTALHVESAILCFSTNDDTPELTQIPQHVFNVLSTERTKSSTQIFQQHLQHNTSSTKLFHSFYTCVENLSKDSSVHIGKNTCIGQIHKIDHIKAQENPIPDSAYEPNQQVHLISANPDVIQKRYQEFSRDKVKMSHLTNIQQEQLFNTLANNFSAFSSSLDTLGHSDRVTPELNFTTNYSIKALPFPIPQALQEQAKIQIDQMVEAGIIEKNIASWACPMLLVKKKGDGKNTSYRIALDLRMLNTVIEHSSYPLPRIQTIITNMSKFKYFTLLDMPSAYWQIHLPEEFQDKISFTCPWGTHKYKRLPFGLKNAASYFQALSDSIIEEINMTGIEAYQDDFIIGSNSFEETLAKLNKLLQIFSKSNLTLNLTKCNFHQTEVDFLGFHLKDNKISPLSANIQKINSFPIPNNKKHVKRFLGLAGFYRTLIPAFAQLTEPLIALTSPKSKFVWTARENEAFQKLQQIFFQKPFIIQPDFNKPFYLNTDASGFAISAVLMQESNGNILPISYFSKGLRGAEKKYAPIQQELMAIVYGVRAFKYLLYGRSFVILSDSKPLSHFRKTDSPAKMITRWLMELGEYTYTFQHLPGRLNVLADFLSRTPVHNNSSTLSNDPNLIYSEEILPIIPNEVNNNINQQPSTQNEAINTNVNNKPPVDPLLEISIESIKFFQEQDKQIKDIINGILNNNSKFKKFLICPSTGLVLYTSATNSRACESISFKIVLPINLRHKCLSIYHLSHFGIDKTYKLISEKFYWPGLFEDVSNFVTSCTTCIQTKNLNIPKAPLQNSFIPSRPGEFLSLDFVGPFSNNMYILTVIDHFSKYLQLYPLKHITAMNTVNAMFDYISVHGRPEMILTDNGTQFKAHIFQEFNQMLGINLRFTTVRNPQANGVSERINKSIKNTIYTLMEDGYKFNNAVRIHQMMYNSSFHSTIKTTPNIVHFGRSLSNFMDTFNPVQYHNRLDVDTDYYMICENLHKLYQEIHDNLTNFQKLQNAKQKNPKTRKFDVGDIVYMIKDTKFHKKSSGPYEIINKVNDVILTIRWLNNPNAPTINAHVNKLRIAPSRNNNRWVTNNSENLNTPRPSSTNINISNTNLNTNNNGNSRPSRRNLQCDTSVIPSPTAVTPSPASVVQPHSYNLRSRL